VGDDFSYSKSCRRVVIVHWPSRCHIDSGNMCIALVSSQTLSFTVSKLFHYFFENLFILWLMADSYSGVVIIQFKLCMLSILSFNFRSSMVEHSRSSWQVITKSLAVEVVLVVRVEVEAVLGMRLENVYIT